MKQAGMRFGIGLAVLVLGITARGQSGTNRTHGLTGLGQTQFAVGSTGGVNRAVTTNQPPFAPVQPVTPPVRGLGFDRQFLRNAAASSLAEILAGQVAQTNSTNTVIQQFGTRLVQDHTASYEQAAALAAELGTEVRTNARPSDRRRVLVLSRLPEERFDRAFTRTMITDHIRTIRQFQTAAQLAQNAEVRRFAREQLPVLTEHLVIALEAREMFLQ